MVFVPPNDSRRADFEARGLPFSRGLPLAADVALYAPLNAQGFPHPQSGIERAERDKETAYAFDLIPSPDVVYFTLAAETGGRFSDACLEFLRACLLAKVAGLEGPVRRMALASWSRRWRSLLSVALHRSVAASVADVTQEQTGLGPTPALGLLLSGEDGPSPMPSRL